LPAKLMILAFPQRHPRGRESGPTTKAAGFSRLQHDPLGSDIALAAHETCPNNVNPVTLGNDRGYIVITGSEP